MSGPHATDDVIAVLPMPTGYALDPEQARRVTCLALAFGLCRGRQVHVVTIRAIARWLYNGESGND